MPVGAQTSLVDAVATAGGLFAAADRFPPVTWSQTTIRESLAPSGELSTTITGTVSGPVSDVVVEVRPNIRPYVKVMPSVLGDLEEGQEFNLTVIIKAPADQIGRSFAGTIRLRRGLDDGIGQSRSKPVRVIISALRPSDDQFPPDPGPENDQTVKGIDSDNDGVRDDIQRYIAFNHASASVRAGLIQYARNLQQALVIGSDQDAARNIADAIGRAAECLYSIVPDDAPEITDSLFAEAVNTAERLAAYDAYDANIDGSIFRIRPLSELERSCDFDPNELGN
jgi:hypothetical protein